MYIFSLIISLAAADYACVFDSKEIGKMKFRGTTREEAHERTARACLSERISLFHALRLTEPKTDQVILFMEDCVNRTYCKEIK